MKIDRVILASNNNPMYYEFWEPLSKVYREKLGIKPTLVWIGTEDEVSKLGLKGEIIVIEPHPSYHIPWQTTWALFYCAARYFNDTSLIIGIDQIPLSGMFIRDMLEYVNPDAYVQMIDDAYLPNHWSLPNGSSPSSYHIAKGYVFNKVYGFEDKFQKEIEKVANSGIQALWENTEGRWGIDESYSCHKIREYWSNGGAVHTFGAFRKLEQNRIECCRNQEPPYDMNRLRTGGYSESHLCRPYSNHKAYIDGILANIPVL